MQSLWPTAAGSNTEWPQLQLVSCSFHILHATTGGIAECKQPIRGVCRLQKQIDSQPAWQQPQSLQAPLPGRSSAPVKHTPVCLSPNQRHRETCKACSKGVRRQASRADHLACNYDFLPWALRSDIGSTRENSTKPLHVDSCRKLRCCLFLRTS